MRVDHDTELPAAAAGRRDRSDKENGPTEVSKRAESAGPPQGDPKRTAPQSSAALDDTARGETPPLSQLPSRIFDCGQPVFPVRDWERYEPLRFLGQGGMGKVFLARDRHLGRSVAIKFVRGDDLELASRFLTEARAQARVQHDHVCKVYEVGEVEGKVYIAMQYIDGQPLGLIAKSLTVEQRAMVVRAAALGLHAAHRVGIIHRDLMLPSRIAV